MDDTQVHDTMLWDEFWAPLLCREDGTVDMDLVKRELADYAYVLEQVAQVYDHITGSRLSKVGSPAKVVIQSGEYVVRAKAVDKYSLPEDTRMPMDIALGVPEDGVPSTEPAYLGIGKKRRRHPDTRKCPVDCNDCD